MPTQQTILEIEIADSESDSDGEIVEKNPPQQVLEEPPKKMLDNPTFNLLALVTVVTLLRQS